MFWMGAFAGYVAGFFIALIFFAAAGRWRESATTAAENAALAQSVKGARNL